ncbi:MAG: hypothetical protein ACRDYZ_10270, partial [Acidimicrobiales bacterium]
MAAGSARPHLVAYPDRLSARPGEPLALMATADVPRRADASLVRLAAGPPGDARRPGDAVRETEVLPLGRVDVVTQHTQCGSFMVAGGGRREWGAGAFTAAVLASPTRLGRRQCLLGQVTERAAWSIELDAEGRPRARASAGSTVVEAAADRGLVPGAWYLVAAGFDPGAGIRLAVRPLRVTASWRVAPDCSIVPEDVEVASRPAIGGLLEAPIVVAARAAGIVPARYDRCFDGRLER